MTTISANSATGVYLASPSYTNPVVIDPGVTISSSGDGVSASTGSWMVENDGTINAAGPAAVDGVYLGAGGSVTNASGAFISGGNDGVFIAGTGNIVNHGSILGSDVGLGEFYISSGIFLVSGSITNAASASVSGGIGIGINGNVGTVINYGSVAGYYSIPDDSGRGTAITLRYGGLVTNAASGSIKGGTNGVFITGGGGTVINDGFILGTGTTGVGVELGSGGSVTNQSNGTIIGYWGITGEGTRTPTTVINSGRVNGTNIHFGGIELGVGGSVTNTTSGSISGNYDGIVIDYTAGTVVNAGTITGAAAGILFQAGGYVSNATTGTIAATYGAGITISGGTGTVINDGSISGVGTNGFGVDLQSGGLMSNASTGTIYATIRAAVAIMGETGTVLNAGVIFSPSSSHADVAFLAGGYLSNASTGTIHSGHDVGVYFGGAAGTAINDGTITAGGTHGAVDLLRGGYISNATIGTISNTGGGDSVYAGGATATIVNAGVMITTGGNFAAVAFFEGGSIYNAQTGTISAIGAPVYAKAVPATLTNAGYVQSVDGDGVVFRAGGSVTNQSTGTISADFAAIYIGNAVATIVNSGLLRGVASDAIVANDGGVVTNETGGRISGGFSGVFLSDAPSTVTNAGTIMAVTDAVQLAAGFANRLIIDPGAVFTGIVTGGNVIGATAVSTLELASNGSTGMLSGLGSQYIDFAQITIDNGASWQLAGENALTAGVTISNAGTLMLSNAALADGGSLINDGEIVLDPSTMTVGNLLGTGSVTISAGSELEIKGAVGSGETIAFSGSGGTLTIDNVPGFAAADISGFTASDKIVLNDFSVKSQEFNADTDQLVLTNLLGNQATLQFTGTHTAADFTSSVVANGNTVALTRLADFNYSNGSSPAGGLVSDANGDLFGTTRYGGASGDGTVFEIANTAAGYASAPTMLVSFNYTDGSGPQGGLITDAKGDLFGTTQNGGANGDGTVFEIANTPTGYASTPTTLVSFNYSDGESPLGNLTVDANGDLFGTTNGGGANNDGTVFEIANTATGYASPPTTLVSFNYFADGAYPQGGLIADVNGDLFGTTGGGGASGAGTVFEIANAATGYASTPTTLVSFSFGDADGVYPYGSPIFDSNGDLFGTTNEGGANGDGTVFEIANTATGYASTPITLVSFNYADGANPDGSLIADANGDLFGTTSGGGANGYGTVFEVANTGTGYAVTPTTLTSFDQSNGSDPQGSLITDANGDLYGTTSQGGVNGGGTVFEITGLPSVITGTAGDQLVLDSGSIDPFGLVTISDSNVGQTETVTVTPSNTANGRLFDPNAASDGSTIADGVYTVTGSPVAVTADLDALVFHPTDHQVPLGQSVTTGFTITVVDTAGQMTTDSSTSVVAVAADPTQVLTSFNNADGRYPEGSLVSDRNGDLFGTTENGGASGSGTVFEIANTATGYVSTPTTLVSFNYYGDGGYPAGSLISDAKGNLFGTTSGGGANYDGTVFEIANTLTGYASAPTTLVSFNSSDGSEPQGSLITDAKGDLFGTTWYGGAYGDGTVFEIANTATGYASTPTTLVSLSGTGGPYGSLIADADGDLFGTTDGGGANGDGSVFEIANTATGYASTPITLVSFNYADGDYPQGSLIADANGDLFGTTEDGGEYGDGTVFEIANTPTGYASTPITLVSFNYTDGAYPQGSLIADANGDLFGTTEDGGAYGDGAVFEIANTPTGYASTPTTLLSFFGAIGTYPRGDLTADARGDLFGTTSQGGAGGNGAVFEISGVDFAVAPPVIAGTAAGQAVADDSVIFPFANVMVTDPNAGQTETLTITLGSTVNGTLFDPNAANDGGSIHNGIYTVSGSADAVTADVDALVFQPIAHEVAFGQTVTTGFTISVTDTFGQTASDTTTSVIATAVGGPRTLVWSGASSGSLTSPANWNDTTDSENPAIAAPNTSDTAMFGAGAAGVTGVLSVAALALGGSDTLLLTAGDGLSATGAITIGETAAAGLTIGQGASLVGGSAAIAAQLGSGGSSVNVTGGESVWQIAGALVVGNAAAGSLNISSGGTVTASSLDTAAQSTGDGVIAVTGTGSALTLTGSLTLGDQAAGELSILGGATVSAQALTIGNANAASSGNVDVEGAGSILQIGNGGVLNVGYAGGGSGLLTIGQGSTLQFSGGIVEAGRASVNNNGGVIDPDSIEFTTAANAGLGENDYSLYVGNIGAVQVTSGTGTWTTPMMLTGTSVADAQNNIDNNGDVGEWQLSSDGTLIVNANTVDGGQAFIFEDATDTLVIGQVVDGDSAGISGVAPTIAAGAENLLAAGGFAATIWGYASGDKIEFDNLIVNSDSIVGGNTLEVFGNGGTLFGSLVFLTKAGNHALGSTPMAAAAAQIACFAAGTRIRTARGEVKVEALREGDVAVTAIDGSDAPIVWIGHREVDCARHPDPRSVWPVRIKAGAFGRGMPKRALTLSPDHAVYVNDVLVPVKHLINGTTIAQVKVDRVTYYHVELERHDVLLADGLPAESYLDVGDRANFANTGPVVRLHMDLAHHWEAGGCAPLVVYGEELEGVKALVAAHEEELRGRPPRARARRAAPRPGGSPRRGPESTRTRRSAA